MSILSWFRFMSALHSNYTYSRARMRHMCSFICTKRTYFIVFHLWGFLRYHIYIHVQRIHILRSIHSDNMFGALKFNYKQRLWVRYATNVRQRNMVMYFTMDSNAASNGINGTHKWWWQCVRSCSIGAWFDMNVLCFVTQANFQHRNATKRNETTLKCKTVIKGEQRHQNNYIIRSASMFDTEFQRKFWYRNQLCGFFVAFKFALKAFFA